MQAGQKLSRHIKKEFKEADLERKLAHIEQFGPILVEGLVHITKSSEARKKKAEEGLKKLLGRDSEEAIADLEEAETKLAAQKSKQNKKLGIEEEDGPAHPEEGAVAESADDEEVEEKPSKKKSSESKESKKAPAKKK